MVTGLQPGERSDGTREGKGGHSMDELPVPFVRQRTGLRTSVLESDIWGFNPLLLFTS